MKYKVSKLLVRSGSFATILLILPLLLLTSCGEDSSGAANVTGQALLGPLSGADVEVIDMSSGELVFNSQTTDSNDLAEAGTFSIPVTAVADQSLYLVRVSGGLDIDANDDGVLDPVAYVNNGEIRLVLTGHRIKQGEFKVSLLSELIYRRIAHILQTDVEQKDLLAEIERRVAMILLRDIDGDGDLDSDDMAIWHPRFNAADIRNGLAAYQAIIKGIHDNDISSSGFLMSADVLLGTSASGRSPSTAVLNNIAYMADGTLGLNIVDINVPNTPVLLASQDTPGLALGVAVIDGIAYVADATSGIQLISVSDPANPVLLAQLTTSGEARGVVVLDGNVYVIDSTDGLLLLDNSNPLHPSVVKTIPIEGEPLGVTTETQFPGRLLVPVRLSDGTEVDVVYQIESSGAVILEGTLGPDPDNPGLEKILVTSPTDIPPDGGITEVPPITSSEGADGSVILEGALGSDSGNGALGSTPVNNPSSGGIEGFQVEDTPIFN